MWEWKAQFFFNSQTSLWFTAQTPFPRLAILPPPPPREAINRRVEGVRIYSQLIATELVLLRYLLYTDEKVEEGLANNNETYVSVLHLFFHAQGKSVVQTIGRQSADNRQTIVRQSADNRLTIGRQSSDNRQTIV